MPVDQTGVQGMPAGATPPTAPPSGAPSMEPQEPSGEIEQAKANVQIAISMMENALPIIGSESEEGKALLSAISGLARKFHGKRSADLGPAELMSQISGMPESYKQDLAMAQGGGGAAQPAGVPGGPHVPANLGV